MVPLRELEPLLADLMALDRVAKSLGSARASG
jgi:hypothetical protein